MCVCVCVGVVISENVFLNNLNVTAGLVGSYSHVVGELFGTHDVSNVAPYVQLEKKINKLSLKTIKFNRNSPNRYNSTKFTMLGK